MISLLLTWGALALAGPTPEDAVEAYLAGDHVRSEAVGRELLEGGSVNADVYYNLGNALYRQGELAEAILAWRRAELLAPRDGDVRANLERARRETRDRLDRPPPEHVLFWRQSLSLSEQGWGAALLLGLVGGLILVRRARPGAPVAIPAALAVIPGVLLALSAVVEARELRQQPGAVVLVQAVEVRSGGGSGVVLFELHAGAEVELREVVGEQAQIALPDGRRGWMSLAALGVVDPAEPFAPEAQGETG
ncbi:MAG: tetratricopeptide repeat protein [Alphaproteobacteria bacterium]|nr:tetratricopeptide repeat protein [Alphaproteobacteria bacterium]